MGITGLLPFLKNASRPAHVSEFKGTTVGIDVYCWLHKGAFGCADKLVKGQKTDGYIVYVMKYVDLLLFHGIKPVLVFDGRNLPSKAETEQKRRENRAKYRKMAKDYLAAGQDKEARECFQRCIDITPSMAREVIVACRERNIDCIVAPYEADAQLAFLRQAQIVDFVISEDSDLTLFGCDKILFKLNIHGDGTLVEMNKLNACLGHKADAFNFEKFRYMCIMSGCDYLSSLHGIGLGKATKFWSKVTNMDLKSVLPKIPAYLNMHQLTVNAEYIDGFIQANQTFLYQLVYDPKNRVLRPLNDYPTHLNADLLPFCGKMTDPDLALQLALGNVDLHSLQIVNNFNPDQPMEVVEKPKYGARSKHKTMWNDQANIETDEDKAEMEREKNRLTVMKCFSALPKDTNQVVVHKKRKREPSSSLVCTPETIENLLEKDTAEDEENVVYKSRFFHPKLRKAEKKQKSADWLESLEDCSPSDNLKYTPDVKNDTKVLKQQIVTNSNKEEDESLSKKRNPFAVAKTPEKKTLGWLQSPSKSSEKKKPSNILTMPFKPVVSSNNTEKSSPPKSQPLMSPPAKKIINFEPVQVLGDQVKSSVQDESTSKYFTKQASPSSPSLLQIKKRPMKGVSGLLRNQPKISDMFRRSQ